MGYAIVQRPAQVMLVMEQFLLPPTDRCVRFVSEQASSSGFLLAEPPAQQQLLDQLMFLLRFV